MTRISPHFTKEEFACSCGCRGQPDVPSDLIRVLEDVRTYFEQPVIINSGYRCYSYNKKIGGATYSQHLLGKASDIVVKGIANNIVQNYLLRKYPNIYGIGLYNTFTHIDVREGIARW
jgi:uncharacterized protein YcbK (DUF882 family)